MLENKIRKFVLRKGLLPGSPFLFSNFIDLVFVVSLLVYTLLRVIKIPITHDEAGTILNFSTQSVWDIISYREPIPNNHIFNTLLIKLFVNLFGYNEFACRLPNILGLLLYLLASIKISHKLFINQLHRISFLILLVANPYIIEFFGLARGYGLSVGFMMCSIYYFFERSTNKSLMAAALGVYTNLTLLNFLFPLLLISTLYKWLHGERKLKNFRELVIIPGVLMIFLVIPIKKMINTDQFKYWGNTGFIHETFFPLLKSSIQGEGYFSQLTFQIFISLILMACLFSVVLFLKISIQHRWRNSLFIYIFILFTGAILYNLLQHVILKIPYLNARTSIFYYPLFIVTVSTAVSEIKRNKAKTIIGAFYMLAGLFGLIHISRTYNLHSSYEWWFDGDNKKVITRIESNHNSKTPVTLKSNWLFQPSLTFYITGKQNKSILPPPYNKSIDSSEIVDFYYITSDDMNDWFRKNYFIDTSFAWNSRYLMKKKQ